MALLKLFFYTFCTVIMSSRHTQAQFGGMGYGGMGPYGMYGVSVRPYPNYGGGYPCMGGIFCGGMYVGFGGYPGIGRYPIFGGGYPFYGNSMSFGFSTASASSFSGGFFG